MQDPAREPGTDRNDADHCQAQAMPAAALAALGVVFGDLGTSPLYTMQGIIAATGSSFHPHAALGILSLICWTLIIVVSIKYCLFVMRADNDGEGGILALMSLTGVDQWRRRTVLLTVMGLLGAALIYGDGVITPAISVLSALEGVNVVTDTLRPFVLPAGIAILIALFRAQKMGTARIGAAFGPIMLLWFVTIGALGLYGIALHPGVLVALDPAYGLDFLYHERAVALLILGGVFLCSTGGEALYADMGHVGRRPVRIAWYAIVLPALLLSYAGQTAVLTDGVVPGKNPFFLLAPHWLRYPLVGLATLATIIASQAIITSAFSMTRQAVQLGWLPRIRVKQTSSDSRGQIYVPDVNWGMALATIAIMLTFQTSERLSGAYGMAVSATMLLTSILLYRAMRTVWKWPLIAVVPLVALFLLVDLSFLGANLLKLADGGYVPIGLALLILLVMLTWRQGARKVDRVVSDATISFDGFLAEIKADGVPRTPGVGVFLTSPENDVPPLIADTVKSFGALKETVVVLSVTVAEVPRIPASRRAEWKTLGDGFWQVWLHYGFMQTPNIPIALRGIEELAGSLDLEHAHYFAARDFVVRDPKAPAMSAWRTRLFAFLFRNGARAPDEFRLPVGTTVEIARQIGI